MFKPLLKPQNICIISVTQPKASCWSEIEAVKKKAPKNATLCILCLNDLIPPQTLSFELKENVQHLHKSVSYMYLVVESTSPWAAANRSRIEATKSPNMPILVAQTQSRTLDEENLSS